MDDDISIVNTEPANDNISIVGQPDTEPATQEPAPEQTPTQEPDKDEPAKEPEKEPEKPATPEKYEFAMPEGFVVDEAAVEAVTPILKELGCSQETAQKLVDLHFAQIKAMQEAQEKAKAETLAKWAREIKADKDIGGPNVLQNLLPGTRLLNKFGSPALTELLQQTGLDRHPAVARFLVAVGREFAEDRWADGGKRGPAGVRTPEAVAKQIFDKTF